MATGGHLLTMIGVVAFYVMLLDSHIEKKLTTYIITVVPRLNKRVIYYIGKLVNFNIFFNSYKWVPCAEAQKYARDTL